MPLPLLLGPVIIGTTLGVGKAIKKISEEKKRSDMVRNLRAKYQRNDFDVIDIALNDDFIHKF